MIWFSPLRQYDILRHSAALAAESIQHLRKHRGGMWCTNLILPHALSYSYHMHSLILTTCTNIILTTCTNLILTTCTLSLAHFTTTLTRASIMTVMLPMDAPNAKRHWCTHTHIDETQMANTHIDETQMANGGTVGSHDGDKGAMILVCATAW